MYTNSTTKAYVLLWHRVYQKNQINSLEKFSPGWVSGCAKIPLSKRVERGGNSWLFFMAFQGDSIYWVEVEKVVPNPFQPRREFDQNKLQELADSIRMYGVLQPLTVTRNEVQREDGTFYTEYELIAGERRLRASKLAGTAQVPVIIREGEQNEQEKLELAIIENLQREDLNAVDRAIAFKQLAEMFGLSHAQVAEKVQRSREYVSNSIRLLGLPEHILEALKFGKMSEGHARTLLMLSDRPEEQDVIFREILLKKMSVREVERIVRKIATDKVRKKSAGDLDSNLIEYEKQFTETLGTRVQIQKTDFGGKLTIDYFSVEDLEGMLERMKIEAAEAEPAQSEVDKLSEHTPLEHVREAQEQPVQAVVTPEPSESTQMPSRERQVFQPQEEASFAQADSDSFGSHHNESVSEPSTQSEVPPQPEVSTTEEYRPIEQVEAQQPQREVYEPQEPAEQPQPQPQPQHQPFASRYAPQSFQNNQPAAQVPQPRVEPVQPEQPVPYDHNRTVETPLVSHENQAPAAPAPQSESVRHETYNTPHSVPGQSEPAPAEEKPEPESDESGLYSIRNFNV